MREAQPSLPDGKLKVVEPLTASRILTTSQSTPSVLPLKRSKAASKSAVELVLSSNNLQALQSGSPMSGFVNGEDWSKHVAGTGISDRPSIGSSSSSVGWTRINSSTATLPAVLSASQLRDVTSPSRRHRFASGVRGLRGPGVVTPRTLAAAEIRLMAYLSTKQDAISAPTGDNSGDDSGDHLGLGNPSLYEFWAIPAPPLPLAPKQQPVEEQLEPLGDDAAIQVLRNVGACASLSDKELRLLLRAGSRKLFQRYAIAMREGAVADGVLIVLQGKLQKHPSRIERQAFARRKESGEHQPPQDPGIMGPSDVFGEVCLVLNITRLSNVVCLEDTEVLKVDSAQLARLPIRPRSAFLESLTSNFIANTLKSLPFFDTLPPLTQRHVSELLEIELFHKDDVLCRQGDPGDSMYILVFGHTKVWRRKKRNAPREIIAEYSGTKSYPWFGEFFLWQPDHRRAGDVIVTEDTLSLRLHRNSVDDFVRLAPGFKAMAMSYASQYSIKARKSRETFEDEDGAFSNRDDMPLKFAAQWTRIVNKLIGGDQMNSAAVMSVHVVRKKYVNTMEWIHDTVTRDTRNDPWAPQTEAEEEALQERLNAFEQFDAQRRKMLAMAQTKHFGDSKTLADTATVGKPWRSDWSTHWSVRTELLSDPSFEFEKAQVRKKMTFKIEPLEESFPVPLRPLTASVRAHAPAAAPWSAPWSAPAPAPAAAPRAALAPAPAAAPLAAPSPAPAAAPLAAPSPAKPTVLFADTLPGGAGA